MIRSKRKIINKLTLISIILIMAVLLTYASPIFNAVNKAYASNITYSIDNGDNLKMTSGASVRMQSQEDSGLRFQVEYNKAYVDDLLSKVGSEYESVSFGSFIVPLGYRERYAITHDGLAGKNVVDISITSFLPNDGDGWYKAFVSIIGLKSANYDREFISRHYVKLVYDNGNIDYIYAPFTTTPRSVYEVAKMAYSDRNSATTSIYLYDTGRSGSYKYSKYSASHLNIIKSFIDAVVVLDKSTMAYAGGLPSGLYTPSYNVSSDRITSTSKIAKMYWNDGTKIQGTTNGSTAKFIVPGANSGRAVLPVYSYSFGIIGGNDVMPIIGNGLRERSEAYAEEHLYGNAFTNKNDGGYVDQLNYWLPEYKALGINIIDDMTFYSAGIKELYKSRLSIIEKYNIGVMTREYNLTRNIYSRHETQEGLDGINERLNELSAYKSFIMLAMKDEPTKKLYIDYIKDAQDNVLADCGSLMSNRAFYSNLLPYNPWNEADYNTDFGTSPSLDAYRNYIDYYVTQLQPKFLSYDMYPFRVYTNGYDDNIDIDGYFSNLSVIREKANQYHIPFWYYIQCGSDWDDSGTGARMPSDSHQSRPTAGEFRWLVNTTLAYGAKGIEYFEANQNPKFSQSADGNPNYSRNGIWGNNGQRNEWYDYALEANTQIKAIDEYLMNATQEGIIVSGSGFGKTQGDIPAGDKRNSYYELQSVSGNVIVGCFNYKGRTALYVVSDATSGNSGSCTLNFNGNYTYTQVKNATKTTSRISGNSITLSGLKAGEGVLIVLD